MGLAVVVEIWFSDDRGAFAPRSSQCARSGDELADRAGVGAGELAARISLKAADAGDPLDLRGAGGLLVGVRQRDDGLLVRVEIRLARLLALGGRPLGIVRH